MRIMDTCRDISVNIINQYFVLRQIIDDYGKDSIQFLESVKKIHEMIFQEHKLYEEIKYPRNEIQLEQERNDKYMGKSSHYLELCKARVLLKLKETEKMLGFIYLDARDLGLSCNIIPTNFKFSLEDAMCSCLEIEVLKKIEKRMDEISKIQCLDKEFIKAVLGEHEDTKFNYLINRFISEILALNSNFNLQQISNFDYSTFTMALKKKYGNKIDEETLSDCLKRMALYTLDFLVPLKEMAATANSYYDYILYSTFFEVYISHMNSNKIAEVAAEYRKMSIPDPVVRKRIKKILANKKKK